MKLEVTVDEANLIIAALARQPFEVVAGLIEKLQKQGQEQLKQQDK